MSDWHRWGYVRPSRPRAAKGGIRAQSQRMPVIMFTTRASAEDRRQASDLGADAYIVKSDFQDSSLLETVRRYAEARP